LNLLNRKLEEHYLKQDLFEDIIARLKGQGIDLNHVRRSDISGVDEFHVRGALVSKELAETIDLKGLKVLDIGCGLGGPCRMLADEYNCRTTGIDLSKEYIRTASELSRLVALDSKTTFIQGDATNLPFDKSSFDVVWTQHVQMNIPDKMKFYSEINRVLKKGGHFLYYDILRKGNRKINYPMPWANTSELSFLFKKIEMENILEDLGLAKVQSTDQTLAGVNFFNALIGKLNEFGPPNMGLNVLMGESTKPKLKNLLAHLQSGELELNSGVYRK
jgi:ubiquinone/menaquinone biosynthesis C-methylase UbiE